MTNGAASFRARKLIADKELSYSGQRQERYDAMMAVLRRGATEGQFKAHYAKFNKWCASKGIRDLRDFPWPPIRTVAETLDDIPGVTGPAPSTTSLRFSIAEYRNRIASQLKSTSSQPGSDDPLAQAFEKAASPARLQKFFGEAQDDQAISDALMAERITILGICVDEAIAERDGYPLKTQAKLKRSVLTWAQLSPRTHASIENSIGRFRGEAFQAIWSNVVIVENIDPTPAVPKSRRGGKVGHNYFPWSSFNQEVVRLLEKNGDFGPLKSSPWKLVACEKTMRDWCAEHWKEPPSESTIRARITRARHQWLSRKSP